MGNDVQDFVILLLDDKGNIDGSNLIADKIHVLKPDEIIGENLKVLSIEGNDTRGLPDKLIDEAIEKGQAVCDSWSTRKDGTRFWSRIVITSLYNKAGKLTGFSKATIALTEVQQNIDKVPTGKSAVTYVSTDNLIRSDARFRALIENSFDAISLIDENAKIIYLSPAARRMIGYSQEETINQSGTYFFHPDDVADVIQRIEFAKQNPGVPISRMNRLKHKDGHYIWTEGITTNLLEDENVRAIVSNFRDITERKLAEEQLQLGKTNLKAIFDHTSEAVILTDKEGIIRLFNANAGKVNLLTCKEEMQVGKCMLDFIVPERRGVFNDMLQRAISGDNIRYDQVFTDFSGNVHCYDFEINPVWENGEITGMCLNGRNITERKLAEEKIATASRLYSFISQIHKIIVHARSESEIFDSTCRIAVDTGEFKVAWVGFFDLSTATIDCVASSGIPNKEEWVKTSISHAENGPIAKVLATEQLTFSNDMARDFTVPYWDKIASKESLCSFIVLPLRKSGKIIGVLNLYAQEKDFFDNKEIALLTEVADGISFAIDAFEKERQRKVMEEKVQHNKLRLKQAQSIARVGSWEYDIETALITFSEEYCKIFGLDPEEKSLTVDSWFSYVHPDDLGYVAAKLKESEELVKDNTFQCRIILRDGTIKHIHSETTYEFDSNGHPISCYGIAQDITAQKLVEEKIINLNRIYLFISQINQIIVHVNSESAMLSEVCKVAVECGKFEMAWINLIDKGISKVKLEAHYNATPGDVATLSSLEYYEDGELTSALENNEVYIINNFEKDNVKPSLRQYALAKGVKSCIVLPIRKFGATIGSYNLFSTKADLFDDEEIRLLREATSDISFALEVFEKEVHRKQMEAILIQNEQRMKQAQAIAHFGSWALEFATGALEWSDEACKIFGLEPGDIYQSYELWLSFVHPDDIDELLAEIKEATETLSSLMSYYRIIRKDGGVRYIYSQAEFEINANGTPIGLRGVVHDITEMKQAELERTKMITDIVQRNKDLEQFSYIVSHNLRAPVANISGLTQILQMPGVNMDNSQKYIQELANSVKRLDDVIMDLNYILQVKQKEIKKIEPVKFSEILDNVKYSIDKIVNENNVSIVDNFSKIDEIYTFKSYLHSVFINLITNSIKYRQPGIDPIINISSNKRDNKIQLIFKDNGLGIDLTKKGEQVFGLYKRFHDHVEGKGMGLYMVKTQIESLGGTIAIDSEINKGTEFTIEFEIS